MRGSLLKTLVSVVALGVAAALGWTVARVTLPAGDTDQGVASPLAVPVESRIIESALIDRGTVGYADVHMSDLRGGIVTRTATPESLVVAGDRVAEVDGRPVFVLLGDIPMYRELSRGAAGVDVAQLQQSLIGLGLRDGEATGVFDAFDGEAVALLYLSAGYEPATVSQPVGVAEFLAEWRALTGGLLDCSDPCTGRIAEIRTVLVDRFARAAPRLPVDEVLFLPALPLRLDSAPAVGSSGGSLRFTAIGTEVRMSVTTTRVAHLEVGMTMRVDGSGVGVGGSGVITSIVPGAGESAGLWIVTAELAPAVPELVGQSVRVTVPLESSGVSVLAVPLSALELQGDGTTAVIVLEPDGSRRRVTVMAGLTADGFVGVDVVSGDLSVGDYVIIADGR